MNELSRSLNTIEVGYVCGTTDDGRPLIASTPSDDGHARPAEVAWMPLAVRWSECRGLRAVIATDTGSDSLLVLALLDAPPCEPQQPVDVLRDGPERLVVRSDKELVLECGKAKIELRADGRIRILGGHLVSHSTGVNKIKGGSVHLN